MLEKKEDIRSRILYTGQQYDQETGQYYLRARYYNPVVGRFMQEDTYRGDGLNLYAYCANNPVMYYDPSGYSCNNNGQNKTDTTPADIVGEGDDRIVTVYRGGDIDQAYATSQKTHEEWIEIWGDEDTYVQAHGEFGTVFELKMPESQLIPQSLKGAGESEFLIVNGT